MILREEIGERRIQTRQSGMDDVLPSSSCVETSRSPKQNPELRKIESTTCEWCDVGVRGILGRAGARGE